MSPLGASAACVTSEPLQALKRDVTLDSCILAFNAFPPDICGLSLLHPEKMGDGHIGFSHIYSET